MKTFKTFLFEEMASNNVSISDVAPQITDTSKNLNFTPPTGPSTKPTKPVGKENTKQPNNKRSDDDDGDDEDFDGWLGHNPMPDPSDYDSDGDGKVDDDKRDEYNQAWQTWRDNLLDWMLQNVQNQEPRFPEDDEPYYPGESDGQWRHWMQEYERTSDERYRQPGDPPLNLPPDMSKEDYEFWKKLLGIRGPESRDIFDWVWRYYRAGQPGFPHVDSPVDTEYPYGTDPLFPNSPSRIPRRPGEYNA